MDECRSAGQLIKNVKMKKTLLLPGLLLAVTTAYSQKYMTRTANVTFFSATSIENIEAVNNEAACIADMKTGQVVMQVPVSSFKFEKALMQEHFNENYMESDKYPKATFKGQIKDISSIQMTRDGSYKVSVEGDLAMHGVTRHVTVPGTITVKKGTVVATGTFKIKPEDYKIEIPAVVSSKIAKEIEITVNAPMKAANQ